MPFYHGSTNQMNTQRRIFRGRGGPTDGRLPKHNARRRKPTATAESANKVEPKYSGPAPEHQTREGVTEDSEESHCHEGGEDWEQNKGGNRAKHGYLDVSAASNFATVDPTACTSITTNDDVLDEGNEKKSLYLQEIKHLKKRIRNVQEGIQTSEAIASPSAYEQNVLNPVRNCVNEWRSIARHYDATKAHDGNADDMAAEESTRTLTDESRKDAGLAVFQLIQLSVQSGPLRGAKPGYFKRCGSQVAHIVLAFLEEVIPNDVLGVCMGFSLKQMDVMNQWRCNAQKASLGEKAPSKSALVTQQTQQQKQHKATKKT